MKAVILAGGLGTRIGEETNLKPKPMIEIGGKPILWHIMKTYSTYGFNEFVILLGYKGYVIKEYFANYFLHQSDITIDLSDNSMSIHQNNSESWKVTLLETGLNTMTGGRIKRAREYIKDDSFLLTYGDGVSDIDIAKLVDFHKKHDKKITMTAVQPAGRYGALELNDDGLVSRFKEKPQGDGAWINGGYFVCDRRVLDYIDDDSTVFEEGPLTQAAEAGEILARKHSGFWQCMDTLRDRTNLCKMWDDNQAPWRVW